MSILEIELTPEMQERLREKAKRRGLEEKTYVQTVVLQDLQEEEAAPEVKKQYNVMDFYGIGSEAWADVDVQKYIHEMRDEWER